MERTQGREHGSRCIGRTEFQPETPAISKNDSAQSARGLSLQVKGPRAGIIAAFSCCSPLKTCRRKYAHSPGVAQAKMGSFRRDLALDLRRFSPTAELEKSAFHDHHIGCLDHRADLGPWSQTQRFGRMLGDHRYDLDPPGELHDPSVLTAPGVTFFTVPPSTLRALIFIGNCPSHEFPDIPSGL